MADATTDTATTEAQDKRKDIRVEELSPEGQAVVKTKRMAGRKRLKHWQQLITELARFDAISDRLEKRASNFTVAGFVAVIVALIAWFIGWIAAPLMQPTSMAVKIPCWAVIALGLALIVYHWPRWSRFAAMDLSNDFRLCLMPLLELLADDIPPRGKVALDLDLAGMTDAKKVKEEEIEPGRYDKIIETIWQDPWCHAAAPLADGSQLVLDVTNQFTRHQRYWHRTKRSGRRKNKRKTKWRKLAIVAASVVPNAEHLAWDEGQISARSAQEKLKLAEKGGAKVCRLVAKCKFKATNEEPEGAPPPEEIVAMFMRLFSMLEPTGAGS